MTLMGQLADGWDFSRGASLRSPRSKTLLGINKISAESTIVGREVINLN